MFYCSINHILYSYKGIKHCGAIRKDFALRRATPVGKLGDPQFCEETAANFLGCYNEM